MLFNVYTLILSSMMVGSSMIGRKPFFGQSMMVGSLARAKRLPSMIVGSFNMVALE